MKRILTLIVLLCCLGIQGLSAQTVYENDFESADSQNEMALFDEDGLTPAANVSFVNDAFVFLDQGWGTGICAISTSWFDPLACCADDWMITPAITIEAGNILTVDDFAPDGTYTDGYEVYVGDAQTVAAMNAGDVVLTIAASQASGFVTRTVDMSAYEGQTVHIGFRNNSNDKFLLALDNIFVGSLTPNNLSVVNAAPASTIITTADLMITTPVSITVANEGSNAITSFDASTSFNGGSGSTMSVTGVNIPVGGEYTFDHDATITSGIANDQSLDVFIENVNGGADSNPTDNNSSVNFDFLPTIPDWTLVNIQGENVRLHDELAAGKTIILDFMASWCGPCELSTPELNQFYIAEGGEQSAELEVYAISIEPTDAIGTMNNLGWGGTYTKFHYAAINDLVYRHFNESLGFVSTDEQGAIPFFAMICPNLDEIAISEVIKVDIGFMDGMFVPGYQSLYDECRSNIDVGGCPADVTVSAAGADLAASAGYTTFQWFLNGTAIAGATSATYSATETGSYSVTATDGAGCESTSVATDVVVCPADVSVSANGFDLGASAGYGSYQWYVDGAAIAGATAANYSAGADGVYTVTGVTADGLCSSTSDGITVQGTGIADVSDAGISIYPNPVKDQLFVELKETSTVSLFDLGGRNVMEVSDLNAGVNALDVSTLNAGVYMIRIDSEAGSFQSRIVLNR